MNVSLLVVSVRGKIILKQHKLTKFSYYLLELYFLFSGAMSLKIKFISEIKNNQEYQVQRHKSNMPMFKDIVGKIATSLRPACSQQISHQAKGRDFLSKLFEYVNKP